MLLKSNIYLSQIAQISSTADLPPADISIFSRTNKILGSFPLTRGKINILLFHKSKERQKKYAAKIRKESSIYYCKEKNSITPRKKN